MKIVNSQLQYPKIKLTKPNLNGYILIAAEIDNYFLYLRNSSRKNELIRKCREIIKGDKNITLFQAILRPTVHQDLLKNKQIAKYDFVTLIKLKSISEIKQFKKSGTYQNIIKEVQKVAKLTYIEDLKCIRKIANVNYNKGIFLFNYFYVNKNSDYLKTWEYTARWFVKETNLNNSILFTPTNKGKYKLINHCHWNRLLDILPSLIFKKSLKKYVRDNFQKNNIAAMPILYKKI